MVICFSLKIQQFLSQVAINLLLLVSFYCPVLWAAQDAMVVVDKAMIFSDREMTSPIGYVIKGKKITVGEIPRNKAQVYPIIVSGKIAYIRVLDVTTEKESMDSSRLVAERFQKNTRPTFRSKFVASYFAFNSQMSLDKTNFAVEDEASYLWHGLSLKGEILMKNKFDVQVLFNYLFTTKEDQKFNVVELGMGGAYRLIDRRKFLLRLEAQLLSIPFSSFSYKDDFRIKSYGYTLGAGVNATYFFDEHWGLEGYGGIYRTKLLGYDAPSPYQDLAPVFIGSRIGIGLNYQY